MSSFIKNVESYCKENKLNDRQFEIKCNLANGTIRNWRKGNEPKITTVMRVSQATGVPVEKWVEE